MSKQVYQIDPITLEFVGYATAYENPMAKIDGIPFNIPRGCVEDEPPTPREGYARVREGVLWVYVADHRGKIMYSTASAAPVKIDFLGSIPDGFTLLVPPPFPVWSKTKWTTDTEAKKAADKEANNIAVKAELAAVDAASVRSIREWLAAQPDAPQFIKDHEKKAQNTRALLQD